MTTKTDDDFNTGVVLGIFAPALAMAYVAPALIWKAYVLTRLWDWYVVSSFGAAPLRLVVAYGLGVLFALVTPSGHGPDDRKWYVKVLMPFFGPAASLFAGWVGTFWL